MEKSYYRKICSKGKVSSANDDVFIVHVRTRLQVEGVWTDRVCHQRHQRKRKWKIKWNQVSARSRHLFRFNSLNALELNGKWKNKIAMHVWFALKMFSFQKYIEKTVRKLFLDASIEKMLFSSSWWLFLISAIQYALCVRCVRMYLCIR